MIGELFAAVGTYFARRHVERYFAKLKDQ